MKFTCLKIFFVLSFLFIVLCDSKNTVFAQAPLNAIPQPYVPCNDIRNNEFHSLRPYQASPCNREVQDTALYCGNDVIITDKFTVRKGDAVSCDEQDGHDVCSFNYPRSQVVVVDLRNAELPIAGNTEEVRNSTNARDAETTPEKITHPQKVNEYISWYLNGVIDRAEYPFNNATDTRDTYPQNGLPDGYDRLVTMSGPLKKLLPQRIQQKERIEEVIRAYESDIGPSSGGTRHNQIVACTGKSAIPIVIGPVVITGPEVPIPCNRQSFLSSIVVNEQKKRLTEWYPEQNRPPLEEDYKDQPFINYWEAYQQWRGKLCAQVPTPLGAILMCVNDPTDSLGIPDYIAELFPYIPFSSTEDRTGRFWLEPNPLGTGQGDDVRNLTIQNSQLSGDTQQDLYFSHMEEDDQLADLLQQMYVPAGIPRNAPAGPSVIAAGRSCEVRKARANPGDNLFGRTLNAQLSYNANFQADFSLPAEGATAECAANAALQGSTNPSCYPDGSYECSNDYGGCGSGSSCSGGCRRKFPDSYDISVSHAISSFTESPYADSLWSRLVAGPASAFKRIFPKIGLNSPISFIEDIPAVTSGSYSTTSPNAEVFAGLPNGQRPGSQAEIFFPHLGGIHEYFLKCVQEMIRPQGLGAGCGDDSFSGSNTAVFGEPIQVSDPTKKSVLPWVTIDQSGSPHIVYIEYNDSNNPESYMYSNNPGSPPTRLAISGVTAPSFDRQSTIMVAGPNNILHFIYLSGNSSRPTLFYTRSTDNGASWSSAEVVSNEAKSVEPHMVVDSSGNAHIVWMDDRTGTYNVYYKVRQASGGFSAEQRPLPAANNQDQGRPQIAVTSDGKAHIVFIYLNDIYYARLDGTTWATQNIGPSPDNAHNPSITTDGTNLYVIWEDNNHSTIVFKSSIDAGNTWSSEIQVAAGSRVDYPYIAYSPGSNRVYAVWVDDLAAPSDQELWYAEYSPSAGAFTQPVQISFLDNAEQTMVPVIATGGGTVGIVWQDQASGEWQVYYLGGIIGAGAPGVPSPGGPVAGACTQTDAEIRTRITTTWSLPSPEAATLNGARGYTQLRSQLTPANANWAALQMLSGERFALSKGFSGVIPYLSTAWVWFENGSAQYPDPYEINCDDEGPTQSRVSVFCEPDADSFYFQIAGYQAQESRKNYREVFTKLYSPAELQGVANRVINDSSKARLPQWKYQGNPDGQSGLLRYLSDAFTPQITWLSTNGRTMTNHPTSQAEERIQFISLLIGKDPAMVAALNASPYGGVSIGDLVNDFKNRGAAERQILSNMAYALYLLDCGK